jgi:hypothetical protein
VTAVFVLATFAGAVPASAATTSTPVGVACHGSVDISGSFTVDATVPDSVRPGQSFTAHVVVHLGDFFGIPAPYSGTLTNTFRFAADGAAPATSTVTLPPAQFQTGDFIESVAVDVPLTVTAASGSTVALHFTEYDYVIVPTGSTGSIANDCPATGSPVIARTTVAATPRSADECKRGGWQHLVDGHGTPFRNQGQCVSYVVSRRA